MDKHHGFGDKIKSLPVGFAHSPNRSSGVTLDVGKNAGDREHSAAASIAHLKESPHEGELCRLPSGVSFPPGQKPARHDCILRWMNSRLVASRTDWGAAAGNLFVKRAAETRINNRKIWRPVSDRQCCAVAEKIGQRLPDHPSKVADIAFTKVVVESPMSRDEDKELIVFAILHVVLVRFERRDDLGFRGIAN